MMGLRSAAEVESSEQDRDSDASLKRKRPEMDELTTFP